MRNWNVYIGRYISRYVYDVSLPMRNWNTLGGMAMEERPAQDVSLPMRNWNRILYPRTRTAKYTMLAYLWGIETLIRRLCWLLCEGDVSLPMRNWNRIAKPYKDKFGGDVSLPMRNWNLAFFTSSTSLKLLMLAYLWGIETLSANSLSQTPLRMLAYLWGIETMVGAAAVRWTKGMLAYLWGIETFFNLDFCDWRLLMLAYLWGIETRIPRHCRTGLGFDVSLPMRNWNPRLKHGL